MTVIEEISYTPHCPRCDWEGVPSRDSLVALYEADQHIATHTGEEQLDLSPFAAAVQELES